jgi:hypothetical protein
MPNCKIKQDVTAIINIRTNGIIQNADKKFSLKKRGLMRGRIECD